jgi:hypothetical protein
MWNQIAAFILKYRLLFIIATVVLTVFMSNGCVIVLA